MAGKEVKKKGKQFKQIAALSGIAIQMGLTIYLFVFVGKKLDASFNPGKKTFLIVFTLVGVVVSLYTVLKRINKLDS